MSCLTIGSVYVESYEKMAQRGAGYFLFKDRYTAELVGCEWALGRGQRCKRPHGRRWKTNELPTDGPPKGPTPWGCVQSDKKFYCNRLSSLGHCGGFGLASSRGVTEANPTISHRLGANQTRDALTQFKDSDLPTEKEDTHHGPSSSHHPWGCRSMMAWGIYHRLVMIWSVQVDACWRKNV